MALCGSANSGKTTLFNRLTGSQYNTVNYPGATVEFALGKFRGSERRLMDTPGLKSLSAATPDEAVTVRALFEGDHRSDVCLCVCDLTQLARHLYLVLQLKEAGFPLVVVATMGDLLAERGRAFRADRLSELLEVPVIPADPRGKGPVPGLEEAMEQAIRTAGEGFRPDAAGLSRLEASFDDERIAGVFETLDAYADLCLVPLEAKREGSAPPLRTAAGSSSWDRLLLHPVAGLAVFLGTMFCIFTAIFWLAAPFMDAIDAAFGWAIEAVRSAVPGQWLPDLLADGLVGGTGAVMVFLPQILILFLAMGWLEDSGYLARGAALVDRPLSKLGLNGRSFVPLLSGYACAIPALMAARTIPNRRERFLTLLIIPLMSCSARLPVYALLLAFLTPRDKPWMGGLGLTALYFLGLVLGAVVAGIAGRFLARREASHFLLELPALRRPQWRVVTVSTAHKAWQYLRKAGPTIVAISLGLWILTHYPSPPPEAGGGESGEYAALSHSYAARIGHYIEPITEPMGLDWRGGVALLCGFAAREVFVGSLALVYRVDGDEDGLTGRLLAAMGDLRFESTGAPIFTTASCLGLLLFYMIALQCFPTVAVARQEMGSWKLALGQLVLFTGGAYALAVALVQGLRALGIP